MDWIASGMVPDDAVVAEARAGSAEAFRVLVERHSRAVYRLAYRMTGSPQDAEDLVQETFLRACKQLHRFDGRASFATWLHRIAANCSVDLLRARRSRERRLVDLTPDDATGVSPLENLPASAPSPETLSMSTEIARHIAPALGQLSRQERAAFVLRHFEGRSIEEIGLALNIRQNAAKHSVFRAVQKLRRVLEPAFRARSPRTSA